MKISFVELPTQRQEVCNRILRALPKWFGIESAIVDYVQEVKAMDTWIAQNENEAIGFISIKKHSAFSAEVYVIGILEAFHRQAIGKLLLQAAEEKLKSEGFRFLQVKTLSENRTDENYEKTRLFYLKRGFVPLEEFKTLWGEHNPCLLMVKNVGAK